MLIYCLKGPKSLSIFENNSLSINLHGFLNFLDKWIANKVPKNLAKNFIFVAIKTFRFV